MDLLQNFSFDNASFLLVRVITIFAAFCFLIFSLIVSRQVQLMNRVLTTKLAPVFQTISVIFIFGAGAILLLSVLSLLG